MSYFLFGLARGPVARNHHLVPRIAVQTIVSVPPRHPPTTLRTPLPRNHPIVPSRNPPVANHRAGSTPMNTSHDIDFDGTLVPLFFPTSRPLPSFRNSLPFVPGFNRYPDLSFSFSLPLFSDEFARLTGCERIYTSRATAATD